jgi:TM2 domain-containing membrane protein YozV
MLLVHTIEFPPMCEHQWLHRISRFHSPMSAHKNKTIAALLACTLGGIGAHRFYLYGRKDGWAWLHLALFPLSIFAGFIGALVIGLTSDEKWDATHNRDSAQQSQSGWQLALLLVCTMGVGTITLIAALARTVDYLYTGGAYG